MCSSSCNLSNRPHKPCHARLPPSPPRSSSSSLIWHHLHQKNLTSEEQWESTYLWIKLSSFLVISNKLVIYTQSTVTVISGWFFLAKNVNNYQLKASILVAAGSSRSEIKIKKNKMLHTCTLSYSTLQSLTLGLTQTQFRKKACIQTLTSLSVTPSVCHNVSLLVNQPVTLHYYSSNQ